MANARLSINTRPTDFPYGQETYPVVFQAEPLDLSKYPQGGYWHDDPFDPQVPRAVQLELLFRLPSPWNNWHTWQTTLMTHRRMLMCVFKQGSWSLFRHIATHCTHVHIDATEPTTEMRECHYKDYTLNNYPAILAIRGSMSNRTVPVAIYEFLAQDAILCQDWNAVAIVITRFAHDLTKTTEEFVRFIKSIDCPELRRNTMLYVGVLLNTVDCNKFSALVEAYNPPSRTMVAAYKLYAVFYRSSISELDIVYFYRLSTEKIPKIEMRYLLDKLYFETHSSVHLNLHLNVNDHHTVFYKFGVPLETIVSEIGTYNFRTNRLFLQVCAAETAFSRLLPVDVVSSTLGYIAKGTDNLQMIGD